MGLITWITRLLYGVGGLAGVGLALLYFLQEKILYVPVVPGMTKEYQYTPDQWAFEYEDVIVKASDGVKLHAWMMWTRHWTPEYRKKRPVILFFQANAGNLSFRLPYLRLMATRLQCSIFAVSYRGYGWSEGSPSEKGLKLDAVAALEHLLQCEDVDTSNIVVLGRSLGGAVALYLAAKHQDKISAVIVENTFLSVEAMAGGVIPPLKHLIGPGKPCNFLITNKWYNLDRIKEITSIPLLMLTSLQDEVVSPAQMRELWQARATDRAQWVDFPDAHHMDAYDASPARYWGALEDFFKQHITAITMEEPAAAN